MERATPVRKPHTSTADLLTWSETPPSDSPAPASRSAVRSHQPSDEISKAVFGGQMPFSLNIMEVVRKIVVALIVVGLAISEKGEGRHVRDVTTSFEYSAMNCSKHSASLSDYGDVGDGKISNTKAFQSAISELSKYSSEGGAQLYVSPGNDSPEVSV